jgi:hypothetical protein
MPTYQLTWQGPALLAKAMRGAVQGLSEFDLRAEGEAKQQLYPGHGKITGTLQRAIVGEPAQSISDTRARGRVAVKGVPYARPIERRYGYLRKGLERVKPRGMDIIGRAIREALRDG